MSQDTEPRGQIPKNVLDKILDSDPLIIDNDTGVKKVAGTIPPKEDETASGKSGGAVAKDLGK